MPNRSPLENDAKTSAGRPRSLNGRRVLAMMMILAAAWLGASYETPAVATTPPTTVLDDFFPEAQPLDNCRGFLERPGCGSEARGGTAQAVLFGILLTGLAIIALRIWSSARRQRT